jgi:hypothetical protein
MFKFAAGIAAAVAFSLAPTSQAQAFDHASLVRFDAPVTPGDFELASPVDVAAIYLDPGAASELSASTEAFADDVKLVSGRRPVILSSLDGPLPASIVMIGIAGRSPAFDRFTEAHHVNTQQVRGKWESAVTTVVPRPLYGVTKALVIDGSDRRGAAFALFTLSRQMGVSPWNWWADVPVAHHARVTVRAQDELQPEPSVQYRGIFLNDEDWGLRPWAAKMMDPQLGNIGPHTYARLFELLLRLHANSLWPAMHPGTLAFNAIPENAELANRWGIVMGSSHSEALLRNNVGEWNEAAPPKGDGPWNYQLNRAAMDAYWDKRLAANGKYENFYTVGLRGLHDSGLEATGSTEVKAHLVEQAIADQRALLAKHVNPDLASVPQVIWLYKESLALYRAGMKVPDDVTLGWTDDNYGYLRQLPTVAEQHRAGGSGIYYHVSYWGFPHDYLWLCTTPPSLIREEMTKAYDHGARRYWILNVGDLKPAESDIDYFLQLAWNEPAMAKLDQTTFLAHWAAEQFPAVSAPKIATVMDQYYQLNFVRKPEFMGFNGYDDGIVRTAFNPLAWGDQNRERVDAWRKVRQQAETIASALPPAYRNAFFELVGYPLQAAAAQNDKFLDTDRSFLDASRHEEAARRADAEAAKAAYDRIQSLTADYNTLEGGKWSGMMSDAPRERHVFEMPRTAVAADAARALPAAWMADHSNTPPPPTGFIGFVEQHGTVSIAAAHYVRKNDGYLAQWQVLKDLGISGDSVLYGAPGILADAPSAALNVESPWLEYRFTTTTKGPANLTLHLLPTFPVDSQHRLRYAISIDGQSPNQLDLAGTGEWKEGNAPEWEGNVRRNSAIATIPIETLAPGQHTLRLWYIDPGVAFEHIVLTFAGAPPAYPAPPETR